MPGPRPCIAANAVLTCRETTRTCDRASAQVASPQPIDAWDLPRAAVHTCGRSQVCTVTACPPGSAHPAGHGPARACRSSLWSHPHGPAAPGSSGCRSRPPAAGYLISGPSGSATRPRPAATSAWCCARTRSSCSRSRGRTAYGSTVTRSFRPLPSRSRISPRTSSRSFTRSVSASSSRNPAPYSSSQTRRTGS
jgi:hypothetical protein